MFALYAGVPYGLVAKDAFGLVGFSSFGHFVTGICFLPGYEKNAFVYKAFELFVVNEAFV